MTTSLTSISTVSSLILNFSSHTKCCVLSVHTHKRQNEKKLFDDERRYETYHPCRYPKLYGGYCCDALDPQLAPRITSYISRLQEIVSQLQCIADCPIITLSRECQSVNALMTDLFFFYNSITHPKVKEKKRIERKPRISDIQSSYWEYYKVRVL